MIMDRLSLTLVGYTIYSYWSKNYDLFDEHQILIALFTNFKNTNFQLVSHTVCILYAGGDHGER